MTNNETITKIILILILLLIIALFISNWFRYRKCKAKIDECSKILDDTQYNGIIFSCLSMKHISGKDYITILDTNRNSTEYHKGSPIYTFYDNLEYIGRFLKEPHFIYNPILKSNIIFSLGKDVLHGAGLLLT